MRKLLILFAIAGLVLCPAYGYSAEKFSIQAGSFSQRANAENFLEYLKDKGDDCRIDETDGAFKVRCWEFDTREEARSFIMDVDDPDYADAFVVISPVIVPPAPPPVPIAAPLPIPEIVAEPAPVVIPPIEGRISGEVMEKRGGYVHPSLSVTWYHTDNLYNTATGKKKDHMYVISPGIMLFVPGVKGTEPDLERRYTTYFKYKTDIERYQRYPSENSNSQLAEGMFRLNSKAGTSFGISDRFTNSYESRGLDKSSTLSEYQDNTFSTFVSFGLSERLTLKATYANFFVDYFNAADKIRDREDNIYSGYLYYKVNPVTSTFLQYEYTSIDYDEDTLNVANATRLADSIKRNVFGGIEWKITGKSTGTLKAGHGIKDHRDGSRKDIEDFVCLGQIKHRFTPKTTLTLHASRRKEETDIATTNYIRSDTGGLVYSQKLSPKVSTTLNLSYQVKKYDGAINFNGVNSFREDELFQGALALRLEFAKWLSSDIGYELEERDSKFTSYDYTTNRTFLRLNASF
jgi:hypothetical protein